MRAFSDELDSRAEIGPECFDLMLYRRNSGQSVREVWLWRGVGKRSAEINLTIGNSRHHIDKEPLPQTCQRIARETCEAKPGASGIVRPDHMSSRVNLLGAVGEIEAQIDGLRGIKRCVALDGHAVFTDVYDLVEIKRGALGLLRKTRVGRGLNLMSHTFATVGDGGSRDRSIGRHGEEPWDCCTILTRDCGKVCREENQWDEVGRGQETEFRTERGIGGQGRVIHMA